MASPHYTLSKPAAPVSSVSTHSPTPHSTSVTISGISRVVGSAEAPKVEERKVTLTKQCSYKEAWERPEEPWTGKMKISNADATIVQVSPVRLEKGNPTLQSLTHKREVQVYEAKPTKHYDNLAGVRVMRAEPFGVAKLERKVVEWPLLPTTQGETRVIKAEPLPVQPVGTRAHPAKEMPHRESFRVSKPMVVKTTEVFSITGARASSPVAGSPSPIKAK
eukprot:GGOE01053540.1.p1 GENE.GGOE01053540.1~~GGOE01053540.1.p1  ORF type:complete len:236 (+),score=68.98 GGOE01053540.1:51-710(+)